ncbi:carbamoyl phosphate synthase small subunit [Alkalihalobacillus trypoxylicola]|uniref:Carbamoyl phosphate synthase small chain n=1 Tax=Alkalihalobacillus trypoxylicola TaxID=519424 RepID=A0A162EEB0_9BACI|nr:carbamoyl phosphate synthase small subunit [Alkalihalobacillus trypoxylicola]KYG32371.1 carbamoyl-phosphate synthase small subunit [Alkalihalobacillus trypoxylicola]
MEGYIVLENGEVFTGEMVGTIEEDIHAEIVFFTGMTGYQEVLSDPSFKGQMVIFTYPLIGNYGINEHDFESLKPQASALIVHELSENGYHYECKHSLELGCEEANIPLIKNVDTRAIVKRIREQGDMRAILTTDPSKVTFDQYEVLENVNVVSQVTSTEITEYGEGDEHVVLIDFGYKKSMVDMLLNKGMKVTVLPYKMVDDHLEALSPDGILLSNGPGNPKQLESELSSIKKLASKYPTLGICLGHQLLALAFGADTKKLRFGHRGANQPVIDTSTNQVYMTSQNHSYVVNEDSLANTGFKPRFYNINDGSIEGLEHEIHPILTIQFHPEAHPGPSDSESMFDMFVEMLKSKGREKVYA